MLKAVESIYDGSRGNTYERQGVLNLVVLVRLVVHQSRALAHEEGAARRGALVGVRHGGEGRGATKTRRKGRGRRRKGGEGKEAAERATKAATKGGGRGKRRAGRKSEKGEARGGEARREKRRGREKRGEVADLLCGQPKDLSHPTLYNSHVGRSVAIIA